MHDDPAPLAPDRVAPGFASSRRRLGRARRLIAAARCEEPDSIAWRDDYGSALEEAQAANRSALDSVHRPVVPQLHADGARFVPPSGGRPARPTIVRAAQAPRPTSTSSWPSASTSPACPRRSSSPRTARSSPSIKAISARPSSIRVFCDDCAGATSRKPGGAQPARRPDRLRRHAAEPRDQPRPKNETRARPVRLLPGQLDLRPQAGSGPGGVHSPPRGTDLSVRHASDERPFPKRARALPPGQRWRLPGHRGGARRRQARRPEVGRALPGSPVPLRHAARTGDAFSRIPIATPWSTSPSRVSACTAFANQGSWSAATHATRSPTRAADTGSPTSAIVTPFWRHALGYRNSSEFLVASFLPERDVWVVRLRRSVQAGMMPGRAVGCRIEARPSHPVAGVAED